MITLTLPWPDPKLSPNRGNRYGKMTEVKVARKLAWAFALKEIAANPVYVSAKMPLCVRFQFYPPDRIRRDLDNLIGSCKAYQDGIFDALGINDHKPSRIEADRCGVFPGGKVIIMNDVHSDGKEMEF